MSSRTFEARTSAGTCYFCGPIARGALVFYLTAKATGDSPERPLTPAEEREVRAYGRAVASARRFGRAAPQAPAWLWERMVHVSCASRNGFPTPRGETEARRGTRTVGRAHGVGIIPEVQAVPAPAPAPVVEVPAQPVAAGLAAAGVRVQPVANVQAAPARRNVRPAAAHNSLPSEGGVARFALLDLSTAPRVGTPADNVQADPGATRFALLDLDD